MAEKVTKTRYVDRDAVVATGTRDPNTFFGVEWGAVFAGVITALMISILLNLLFVGIGLQSIDPSREANPLAGTGTGSIIAIVITNLVSLFAGGFVAGRLAGYKEGLSSTMTGILVWALLTLATLFAASTLAGRLLSGVTSALTSSVSALGQGAAAIAPEASQALEDALAQRDLSVQDLQSQVTGLLNSVDNPELDPDNLEDTAQAAGDDIQDAATDIAQDPTQAGERLSSLANNIFRQGRDITEDLDNEDLIDAIVNETGVSREEAQETVDSYRQTYQEIQAQVDDAQAAVSEATTQATDALGTAAFVAFIALLIGAGVAVFGAATGRPDTDRTAARIT